MAIKLTRKVFVNPCFLSYNSSRFLVRLSSDHDTRFFLSKIFGGLQESGVICRHLSFSPATSLERLSWEGSSHTVLLTKLENALKDLKLDEAWETFNDFIRLYGFPNHLLVSRFITQLSYSSSPCSLQKAYDLVMMVLREKSYHLQPDILVKLALSLSRAQMPIPSSTILRLMLEKGMLPPMNVLQLLFLHMVKTEVGACIASNLLIQICDNYVQFCSGKSPCANLLKPDTVIFNLVLDACVRFGSSLKGQQIIELMSQTGVVADAHSIIIIAQIHEINGQRDELKKFKDHVAPLPVAFVSHYRQFYECLLSLHFKFDDIDAAAELLLDMNRSRGSHPVDDPGRDFQKPHFVPIGSQNLRNGLKIQIMPELIHKDSALKEEGRSPLSIKEASSIYQPSLSKCLFEEVSDAEKAVSHIIYELNSSIYFFSKAKMMGDALNIYRRMQEMKIQPTEHTFMYLVCGYSSLEMYRDVTILWGDMKRIMETGSLTLSSDLYEFLLLNFLRGGYFERVMEVIDYMNKCNMYVDKWMHKSEYLKIHKNLYRSLKASKARTEAQGKRFEYVKAFKKWAGIN